MKVLFVCLGNICRSPAAEAILKQKAEERGLSLEVSSSAVGDWHVGQLRDPRTRDAGAKRGLAISGRAKLFKIEDMHDYDYIFAVDRQVLHHLQRFITPGQKAKVALITKYSPSFPDMEIPDPFYGNEAAFENVFDILDDACEGFLKQVVQ